MLTNQAIFQFKISLRGAEPSIWRRINISSRVTFFDFHRAIRDAMGWKDIHVHQFELKNYFADLRGRNDIIGISGPGAGHTISEKTVTLDGYFPLARRARYLYYDFGNSWDHEVNLEVVLPVLPGVQYPVCVDGARTAPPDDCGGIAGYRELVKIMMDLNHPERAKRMEWMDVIGYKFQPELFDPVAVVFLALADEEVLQAEAVVRRSVKF